MRKQTMSAQSILALIDGEKVLDNLEGLQRCEPSLDTELSLLVSSLQGAANRPIQFIITKSDLLQHRPFGDLRKEISKTEAFCNFVTQRRKSKLPTYLIPISAVGNAFAYLDRSTMLVKKKPDGVIAPYNLDLTIGFTILDQLQLIAKRIEGMEERKSTLSVVLLQIARLLGLVQKLDSTAVDLSSLMSAVFGIPVQLKPVLTALKEASRKLQHTAVELDREVAAAMSKVSDRRTAIEGITLVQNLIRDDFFSHYPESDLGQEV